MTNKEDLKKFNKGDFLMKQGDEGHSAFVIEDGHVEILIEKENGFVQSLGTRGPGSIVGEMALVDNKPRTATILLIEDCTFLEITRDDFENRLNSTDPVVNMIMQVIMARYRDMVSRAHIMNKHTGFPTPEELEKNLVNNTNAVQELTLLNELKKALKENELELYYQPIYDIQKNKIAGFEALVRWNHPQKGLIYPDDFIEAAENSGLIVDLTRWAIQESCVFLNKIQIQFKHLADCFMSVNFSAKDFLEPNFKNHIIDCIKANNLKPHQFHIEITERLLMDQPSESSKILDQCRDEGMLVSIDDFGTGFSSLSYLHHFPIDILKIDRSFIADMDKDQSSENLVKSIINLGHNMNMSIIAEGIETEEQASTLKKLSCDKTQGYLYTRPLPVAEIQEFLAKNA